MYNTAMKKINRFGKIGKQVITVLMVITVILTAVTAGLAGYLLSLPEDAVKMQVSADADLDVQEELFAPLWNTLADGVTYSSEQMPDLENGALLPPEDTPLKVSLSIFDLEASTAVIHSDAGRKLVHAETEPVQYEAADFAKLLWWCVLAAVSGIAALFMMRRLFCGFEQCESPFREEVVKRMRQFTFSLLPFAILVSVAETAAETILYPKEGLNLYVEWGAFAAFVIALCLGTVFRYGAQLQQESDETL